MDNIPTGDEVSTNTNIHEICHSCSQLF